MKYTSTIATLVALFSSSASAVENARDLARSCQQVEAGTRGKGKNIRIPNTKEARQCWVYMQAMQNISVIVDQDGNRLIGSCPPEDTTLLQLIHSFVAYAHAHPKELEGNAAVAVVKALQEAFPCHAGALD